MATYSSNTSNGYKLILEVTQSSQSIAGNSSVLKWTLKMSCATQYYQNSSTTDAFKVSINGTAVYNTSKAISFSGKNTTVTISSGTITVSHNADGKKTVSLSFSYTPGRTASYYPSSMSGSGSMNLTTIPRASSLSVTSGDDTKPGAGNIVLSISRASTSFTHTVTWSCAGLSGTIGTGLTTSASWAVPIDIISKSPNASQTVTFTCTTYNGNTNIGTSTVTATVGYYGSSTVSASSGTTIGNSKSFTISRGNTNFTHSMWYSFGSKTWQVIGSSLSASASFTPPLSLCNEIPNAISGSMTIILRTYYGNTQIGSDQYYYYTMNVPETIIPTISDFICTEANTEVRELIGEYVQNRSRLSLEIIGAAGSYGSAIRSYKIAGCGHTLNTVSGTTEVVTESGAQTITATVTDSRGRTASKTIDINVLAYHGSKLTQAAVERNSDTTAHVSGQLECSSLIVNKEEKNILRYKIAYKATDAYGFTELEGTYESLSSELSRTITGLDANKSYEMRIYVGDIFGYNEAYTPIRISTAFTPFDLDVKEGRLGIQKALEYKDSLLEVPEDAKMYVGSTMIEMSLLKGYRVGDIIISVNAENPSVTYGGTWELLCPGRTLVCIDTGDSDFSAVKKTGGSKSVALTTSQMPSHTHGMNSHTHSVSLTSGSGGAHTPSGTIATRSLTGTFTAMRGGASGVFTQKSESAYTYGGTGTTREIVSMDASHSHSFTGSAVAAHTHSISGTTGGSTSSTSSTGSSSSHTNLQPYMAVYMWVKVK